MPKVQMPNYDTNELSKDRLLVMTEDQAVNFIENAVYEASALFERLEWVNKVRGNGHHIRQNIAAKAGELMRERWNKV